MTLFSELLQEVVVQAHCGVYFTWRTRGFHVQGEKGKNFIGLAVTDVRLDRKRLMSLLGVFLSLPESKLSQVKR